MCDLPPAPTNTGTAAELPDSLNPQNKKPKGRIHKNKKIVSSFRKNIKVSNFNSHS